ncbi:hypothetical protein MRS44_012368 [Fusarium solani]|uniref:uncharacterized protein n=1 Tax=Fusarium solani TaxID=169388 RepID=UPI0032C4564B|nr:hypothetical protein MRS44_012368 [Fusarium solani]
MPLSQASPQNMQQKEQKSSEAERRVPRISKLPTWGEPRAVRGPGGQSAETNLGTLAIIRDDGAEKLG